MPRLTLCAACTAALLLWYMPSASGAARASTKGYQTPRLERFSYFLLMLGPITKLPTVMSVAIVVTILHCHVPTPNLPPASPHSERTSVIHRAPVLCGTRRRVVHVPSCPAANRVRSETYQKPTPCSSLHAPLARSWQDLTTIVTRSCIWPHHLHSLVLQTTPS